MLHTKIMWLLIFLWFLDTEVQRANPITSSYIKICFISLFLFNFESNAYKNTPKMQFERLQQKQSRLKGRWMNLCKSPSSSCVTTRWSAHFGKSSLKKIKSWNRSQLLFTFIIIWSFISLAFLSNFKIQQPLIVWLLGVLFSRFSVGPFKYPPDCYAAGLSISLFLLAHK